jgi:hypothetical protein
MRGTTSWLIIRAVDETTVTISLELRLMDDSLTGTATGDDGAPRCFSGWIGLMATIDALVPTRPPSTTPGPNTPPTTTQGGHS